MASYRDVRQSSGGNGQKGSGSSSAEQLYAWESSPGREEMSDKLDVVKERFSAYQPYREESSSVNQQYGGESPYAEQPYDPPAQLRGVERSSAGWEEMSRKLDEVKEGSKKNKKSGKDKGKKINKEWPGGREDVENAYYEGRKYIPLKFATDADTSIKGEKAILLGDFDRIVRKPPESDRKAMKAYNRARKRSERYTKVIKRNHTEEQWEKHMVELAELAQIPFEDGEKAPGAESFTPEKIKVLSGPNPDFNCNSHAFTDGRTGHLEDEEMIGAILKDNYRIIGYHKYVKSPYDRTKTPMSNQKEPLEVGDRVVCSREVRRDDHKIIHSCIVNRIDEDTGEKYVASKLGADGVLEHPIDGIRVLYPEVERWNVYRMKKPLKRANE